MSTKPLIINVLDKDTFGDCHIKGSVNMPLAELESHVKSVGKDTPIIVYCASYRCGASGQAYEKLKELGFTNVRAYEGGVAEWVQDGLPTNGECKLEYIHKRYEKSESGPEIEEVTKEELKIHVCPDCDCPCDCVNKGCDCGCGTGSCSCSKDGCGCE